MTRPCTADSSTDRSLSSRIRMVISPEMVSSEIRLSRGGLSRSAVSEPETVVAFTCRAARSASVISPDTVSSARSPAQPSASTGPDTMVARVRPLIPSSAIRPLVHSTVRSPRMPDTANAQASAPTRLTRPRWRERRAVSPRRQATATSSPLSDTNSMKATALAGLATVAAVIEPL